MNDAASTALVKGALVALDERIWKLYGTVSRKGDSTADRPHRRSAVLEAPPRPDAVPADLLRTLAGPAPAAAVPAPVPAG